MSAVMVHPVLAELEQRAGASDQDKPAWLAERMTGITATEVRDLYLKGPTFKRELIEKKLGIRVDDFHGNAYTEWGKEREPVIAAAVQERFAIAAESRVFHAADNARFLASPDGLGVDFDEQLRGAEIKTAGKDVSIGSTGFDEKGYRYQMIWCMRVTGARRWLYAWEYRLPGESTQFVPGQLSFEWIGYDAHLAAELEAIALDFLAELDAARAALEAGDGPVVDEELDTLAVNLLRFREMESEGKRAKESAWADLQTALAARGGDFSQESTLARITYTAAVSGTAEVVDPEAAIASGVEAKRRYEALLRARAALAKKEAWWAEFAATFTKSVPSTKRAGLTVTSVKPPKEKKA